MSTAKWRTTKSASNHERCFTGLSACIRGYTLYTAAAFPLFVKTAFLSQYQNESVRVCAGVYPDYSNWGLLGRAVFGFGVETGCLRFWTGISGTLTWQNPQTPRKKLTEWRQNLWRKSRKKNLGKVHTHNTCTSSECGIRSSQWDAIFLKGCTMSWIDVNYIHIETHKYFGAWISSIKIHIRPTYMVLFILFKCMVLVLGF